MSTWAALEDRWEKLCDVEVRENLWSRPTRSIRLVSSPTPNESLDSFPFSHLPTTGKVADQKTSLLEANGDHEAIEPAHRLYQQLASSNNTIEELRARFQPLADARKPVLVGIAAKLGYRTDATREEIAERLLQTLEGLNVSRVRNELIRAAT